MLFDQLHGGLRRAPCPGDLFSQIVQLGESLLALAVSQLTPILLGKRPEDRYRLAADRDDGEAPNGAVDPGREPLTPRERQVLALVARGLSNRAIAERLSVSPHTAKTHVSSIYGKLGAANRAEAVRRGIRLGLLEV